MTGACGPYNIGGSATIMKMDRSGIGLDWWSTVFSDGADPFLFRGSEGRLVYVG